MTSALKNLLTIAATMSLLVYPIPAFSGSREKGVELYNATTNWQVLVADATGIWYFDPYSIINNGTQWDINATFVNNDHQYDPDETQTLTVDCSNRRIKLAGWRINGVMDYYKGRLGSWRNIEEGTSARLINSWLCGLSYAGHMYHGIVADFEQVGQNETFEQWWIRDNEIYMSQDNANIRMTYILYYKMSTNMNYLGAMYAKCSNNLIMMVDDGKAVTGWIAVPQTAPLRVLINRVCAGNSPYLKITYQKMDTPEPLSPVPTPDVATAQRPVVQNPSYTPSGVQEARSEVDSSPQRQKASRRPKDSVETKIMLPPPNQTVRTYTYGGVTVTCETVSGSTACH